MQVDAELSTRGLYKPGVFQLEIATQSDLSDLNKLDERTLSTFLHEYVHFLQDVTTTHGLLNFIGYNQYLKNVIKKVMDEEGDEFDTPVKISNEHEYKTNEKLRLIYYGDPIREAEKIKYSGYEIENVSVVRNSGGTIPVKKFKVKYYDEGAFSNEVCHFGSLHIKEYMAHAIQNLFAPNTSHKHIPYVLVEMLIATEYPELARDPALVVALCEASLMHYHPADLFFDALSRMKALQWKPTGVKSVYDFVFEGRELGQNGQTETFASLYSKTATDAKNFFGDALKDQYFKENVIWFNQVVDAAVHLRSLGDCFLAKLVSSPGHFSAVFAKVFGDLGTPFMTNSRYHGYFLAPQKLQSRKIQPYLPLVFFAILKTFKGEKDCQLHSFCKTLSLRNITDENCEKSPWERIHQSELCPYAVIWHTWGLANKKPRTVSN